MTEETTDIAKTDPPKAAEPSLVERIETVFSARIRGSRLSTDTELWNLVRGAFDDVKTLVGEHVAKLAHDL